ncbi:MAG: diaminopimelate decarboxylase [Gammaproteobacteria bacterium]|nr:diaminopimelate decarboxylase [Gammaproteobacteria bacterium]
MENFTFKNNQLFAEAVALTRIAEEFGTPCFVYSRAALEQQYRAYEEALAGCSHLVCYAVKANSNLAVLSVLAKLGSGFDIVSGGELARVIAAGGDPARVIFSGVGKTIEEMHAALDAGIHCFNVESPLELEQLNDVAMQRNVRAPVSIRVNPDVDAKTHPYISTGLKENKFGVSMEDARLLYRQASTMAGLELIGLDFHIGSQLTSIEPFLAALERTLLLIDELAAEGISIRHLDIGGGLGVQYRDETPPAPQELIHAVRQVLGERPLTLVLEPGRSICANAGVLLTHVNNIKTNGEHRFAIVDAAMNDIIRPALYQAWMDVVPVKVNETAAVHTYDLVGPICETGDFIGRQRELAIDNGDLLAVRSAGAYCFAMSSNYNTRNRAAEVLVDGDQVHLARRRETYEDQLALENPLD